MKEDFSENNNQKHPEYIIGIGASAGGLEALTTFFSHAPSDTNMAFVIIQHLSPDHKSLMDTLLARHTEMDIFLVKDGMTIEANRIYLIPPKHFLTIFKNKLLLKEFDKERGINLPIDVFFLSLAEDIGPKSIGIILSGTGSDGTIGLKAIKKAGGMVMVQNVETAQFDGMPRSAIGTGMVDYICPPDNMPDMMLNYTKHPYISKNGENESLLSPENTDFNKILALLRNRTDVDFTYYKPNTVIRRIERRMGIAQTESIREYLHYLYENNDEIDLLYRDLLVGVTRFFRDTDEFNFLKEQVIPKIFENTQKEKKIRVWVAGTSTGEEAYTIVMLLNWYKATAGLPHKITVFATDIDPHALEKAANGVYPEGIVNDLDKDLIDKYFHKSKTEYKVKTFIREQVIFARQNIFKDPPFTKLDLITCRNLLIYLQNNLQKNIMDIFHFALKDKGFLFLGTSESVGTLSNHFIPMDSRIKIFRHAGQGPPPLKTSYQHKALTGKIRQATQTDNALFPTKQKEKIEAYYQSIINEICQLSVVVDESGNIVEVFGNPERFLKFPLGKANLNIHNLVHPKLSMILSTGIRKVLIEKNQVVYRDYIVGEKENRFVINIKLSPIRMYQEIGRHVLIIFQESDLNTSKDIQESDIKLNTEQHIRDLEKEIQYTRENHQATIEELHSSNEELQSTNEELLSSNEELQSTNEELNSVNEELNTVNAEYQEKVTELYETNNDLSNLIKSIDIGCIFLDKNLCIRKFTPAITDEVNLFLQDTGRPISVFSSPILKQLSKEAKNVMDNDIVIERTVQGEKGKWYLLKILPYKDERSTIGGVVMSMIDITREKQDSLKIETQNEYLKKLIAINPKPTIVTDDNGIVLTINQAAEKTFHISRKEHIQFSMDHLFKRITDINDIPLAKEDMPVQKIIDTGKSLDKYIVKIHLKNENIIVMSIFGNPLLNRDNIIENIVFVFEIIAHHKD
jgi:two-component system CheB/CheR fusion protein